MTLDSPDYSRAIVASQILLATVPDPTLSVDIALLPTITALWIYVNGANGTPLPTVVGDVTGMPYAVYATLIASTGFGGIGPAIALVNPVMDLAVTVTVPATGGATWYVVGDTSMRVTASLPLTVYGPV